MEREDLSFRLQLAKDAIGRSSSDTDNVAALMATIAAIGVAFVDELKETNRHLAAMRKGE